VGDIHADLLPENDFYLHDTQSGLIDFYFACTDMLAYDVAVCLNAWCFEPDHSYNVTKGRALLKAYEAVRPLAPDERDALPVLARGAAMRFLLTRLVDWLAVPEGALVKPKDPLEYYRKLRFHQSVSRAADYGCDA
jgi:homoserine kinase type II